MEEALVLRDFLLLTHHERPELLLFIAVALIGSSEESKKALLACARERWRECACAGFCALAAVAAVHRSAGAYAALAAVVLASAGRLLWHVAVCHPQSPFFQTVGAEVQGAGTSWLLGVVGVAAGGIAGVVRVILARLTVGERERGAALF